MRKNTIFQDFLLFTAISATPGEKSETVKIGRLGCTVGGFGVFFRLGKEKTRLMVTRHVVWYHVLPGKFIRLTISRDPEGIEEDDYFFTTDLQLDAGLLVSRFANRWAIEDTFRNVKQFLGIEQPQSWKGPGPERVAAVGYAIYSLVWSWFIKNGDFHAFPNRPWYITKTTPSFQDALAGIRHLIWVSRFSATVPDTPESHKFSEIMIESLSRVA